MGGQSEIEKPQLSDVVVPSEHGGWSLTIEPVLLGLLVAPSWLGVLLGLLAVLAFMMRTPVKMVLVDRIRGRSLARTQLARKVALYEAALALAGVVILLTATDKAFLWPLAVAAPLVAIEFWYDVHSRSRRLIPELAGSVGIGAAASAVALLGGADVGLALGLWLAIAARAAAAIPFVRVQLRRAKSQPFRMASSDGAQAGAVVIVMCGAIAGLVSWVAVAAIGVVAGTHLWLARTPPPSAQMVGAQQVVVGLFVILTVGLGAIAP